MKPTCNAFPAGARAALADANMQAAFRGLQRVTPMMRQAAIDRLPEFPRLCDAARQIKDHVLANLDQYLERFEARVIESGGQVHWCETPDQARRLILDICRQAGARRVTKGKSMVSEEIGINEHLEAQGIQVVETDLGEYIVQQAGERPSHIIAPAIHKTVPQISDLFLERHASRGFDRREDRPERLVAQARAVLREHFLAADVGITGANFLIAETGTTVLVTNEGNGDLTQTLPPVHIVIASIEKVVPAFEDAACLLRLLARSAAGQELTVYTTFTTGPRRTSDVDGPQAFHVVLLDNGRAHLLATPAREVLRCIKCGACQNHCPVYGIAGGHAYGWVYAGPIGAALEPAFLGPAKTRYLPGASTLCGRCEEVCPVAIPLPQIFRYWRGEIFSHGLGPWRERWGLWVWAALARHPKVYRRAVRLVNRALRLIAGRAGRLRRLPLAGAWTASRDLPAPLGCSFFDQWRKMRDRS